MPRVRNYVNNKDLTAAIVAYQKACKVAEHEGRPTPTIPNYVGQCIMQICNRLTRGFGFDFTGHTYRDEMVGDAIELCVYAVRKFNADKSSSGAFSYLTTVAINAMKKRIGDERKQQYIKHKHFSSMYVLGDFDGATPNEHSDKVISDYEDRIINKQKKPLTSQSNSSRIKEQRKKNAKRKVV